MTFPILHSLIAIFNWRVIIHAIIPIIYSCWKCANQQCKSSRAQPWFWGRYTQTPGPEILLEIEPMTCATTRAHQHWCSTLSQAVSILMLNLLLCMSVYLYEMHVPLYGSYYFLLFCRRNYFTREGKNVSKLEIFTKYQKIRAWLQYTALTRK